jgi:DNA repair exonuclease SbcCD nuclease subunit
MKFIHAADLHIDSPLLGLDRLEGAPAEMIRRAPREAFRRLIDLALAERADFVILAGDVFDGPWRDMSTGLFFCRELERLNPIPVFVALGNHDAHSTIVSRLPWPDHVKRFKESSPETYELRTLNTALHGQSFATRAVVDDLAAGFPAALSGMTNIGVLHTSLAGYQGHERYAPTSLDVLRGKGYDAWCLGHIHQRTVVARDPLVLYPGNIQGRHIGERGARGCFIIDDDAGVLRETFHPLDSLRWELIDINAAQLETFDEVLNTTRNGITTLREQHDDRLLCIRVRLRGATPANTLLRRDADDFRGALVLDGAGEDVWVESVHIQTTSPRSLVEVRRRADLVGEIFAALAGARVDQEQRARLTDALRDVQAKIPREVVEMYATRFDDPDVLNEAIAEAEELLLARIA